MVLILSISLVFFINNTVHIKAIIISVNSEITGYIIIRGGDEGY